VDPEAPAQPWDGKPTRVLEHDLGRVRPGQKVRHRFTIANDSGSTWTLACLHNGCACTAAQLLTKAVLPGNCMEVDVDYTAAPLNSDDRRRVGVEFAEEDAPFVWLEMRACIRAPISVFPPRPTIVPARGDHGESLFEIHNCTDQDVHTLSVRSSDPWLTVRPPIPIMHSDHAGARQMWRVNVAAKTDGLQAGRHPGHIDIQTDCLEAPATLVMVELDLRLPVEAVPGQLAFGILSPGSSAQRKVFLRYDTEGASPDPPQISLSHDLGPQLHVSYAALSDTRGQLSATLTASATGAGDVKGLIVVTFEGRDLLPLEIPVSATVHLP
jgi:hypothetical protein